MPPPPGGGSAITATEPKPKRTAKTRINLLIKGFLVEGSRGSIAREFVGNAFGRQSRNGAGNAGSAVVADKAGNWIWSLEARVFTTPSCLHQHASDVCLNSRKIKSWCWLVKTGKGRHKTLGAASNPLTAFPALPAFSALLISGLSPAGRAEIDR